MRVLGAPPDLQGRAFGFRHAVDRHRFMADPESLQGHGLLYLPHPYVVPGGRFNEMFGWDSYFIAQGLLLEGEVELARGMTDNCLYEVEHYGTVLNAIRTYYLSRSQPPLLGRMVVEVFEHTRDLTWLARREPRWIPSTGLSRYHGTVDTPAPEVVHSEVVRERAALEQCQRCRNAPFEPSPAPPVARPRESAPVSRPPPDAPSTSWKSGPVHASTPLASSRRRGQ